MALVDNKYYEQFQLDYIVYFKDNNLDYASVQHYFQSKKSVVPDISDIIRMARTPKEAYLLGNRFIKRSDWEEIRNQIMFDANFLKFNQNEYLKKLLLSTKGNIECVDIGEYWGKPNEEEGKNILGQILTALRAYFNNDNDTFSRYIVSLHIRDISRIIISNSKI